MKRVPAFERRPQVADGPCRTVCDRPLYTRPRSHRLGPVGLSAVDLPYKFVERRRRLGRIGRLELSPRVLEIVDRRGKRHQRAHFRKLRVRTQLPPDLVFEEIPKQHVIDLLVVVQCVKIKPCKHRQPFLI